MNDVEDRDVSGERPLLVRTFNSYTIALNGYW